MQCVPCVYIQSDTVGDGSCEAALIFLMLLSNEAFSVLVLITMNVSFGVKLSQWLVLVNKVYWSTAIPVGYFSVLSHCRVEQLYWAQHGLHHFPAGLSVESLPALHKPGPLMGFLLSPCLLAAFFL